MPDFDLSKILKLRYIPAPRFELDEEKEKTFEAIFESAVGAGPEKAVTYNCAHPKYEFLHFLVNNKKLLLHGSNLTHIGVLSPMRMSSDTRAWADRKAVYTCSDAIFPIFYAILDRRVYSAPLIADVFAVKKDGVTVNKFYHFAIAPEMLIRKPWTDGMVYAVERDSFEQLRNDALEYVDEWASRDAVPVLAKIPVSPADFPYLADVQPHGRRRTDSTRPSAVVDPALYESYAGEYQAGPDFLIRVNIERGGLYAQARGYPSVELRPISETRFALSAVNGEITFLKDDSGAVMGLTLRLGGQELPAVKKAKGGRVS